MTKFRVLQPTELRGILYQPGAVVDLPEGAQIAGNLEYHPNQDAPVTVPARAHIPHVPVVPV